MVFVHQHERGIALAIGRPMSEPIRSMPGYELYRVITDYEALQDGFLDRIEDLDTTLDSVDAAGKMTRGNLQKLLTKSPGKRGADRIASGKRTFGWESLKKTLEGTGLALVLVIDDARFAPIKEQLAKRKRPRKLANASIVRPTWLFCKGKAREMGKKRWAAIPGAKRTRLMRKAAKARWSKREIHV